MLVRRILGQIRADSSCRLYLPAGQPKIPEDLSLPEDLRQFYEDCGGASLFMHRDYGMAIVSPPGFVRANPVIVGEESAGDITYDWFLVACASEQYISIDLNPERLGRCYDSFWDRHGVAGQCPIIARSFTELLQRLFESKGGRWFWLSKGFQPIGDAYD